MESRERRTLFPFLPACVGGLVLLLGLALPQEAGAARVQGVVLRTYKTKPHCYSPSSEATDVADGSAVPVRGARIEVRDAQGWVYSGVTGSGEPGDEAAGHFDITVGPLLANYAVHLVLESDFATIADEAEPGEPIRLLLDSGGSPGDVDLGTVLINGGFPGADPLVRPGLGILEKIRLAAQYTQERGLAPGKVNVRLVSGVSQYVDDFAVNRIELDKDNDLWFDEVLHEYGHYVDDIIRPFNPTLAWGTADQRCVAASSEGAAFREGWATYFAAAVKDEPEAWNVDCDLEGGCASAAATDLSGATFAMLWDLHDDATTETYDTIGAQDQRIWDTLASFQNPVTHPDLEEFVARFADSRAEPLLCHYGGVCNGTPPAQMWTDLTTLFTQTTATFHGSVNPSGSSTGAAFKFGTGPILDQQTPVVWLGSPSSVQAVDTAVSGLSCGTTYYLRLVAANGGGTAEAANTQSFATLPCSAAAPIATTGTAQEIGQSNALLSGTVNPNGRDTDAWIRYRPDGGSWSETGHATVLAIDGTTSLYLPALGLTCGSSYEFQAMATNEGGPGTGGTESFVTQACPGAAPTVTTLAADTPVKNGSTDHWTTTLRGQADPNGADTYWRFDLGKSLSYETSLIGFNTIPAGSGPVAVAEERDDLDCATTYHFRVVGRHVSGSIYVYGADQTFTTGACSPKAVTGEVSEIGSTAATLNALVTPNGTPTNGWFRYRYTTAMSWIESSPQSLGSGSLPVSIAQPVAALLCGTSYTFNVRAENSSGYRDTGSDRTFTTLPCRPAVSTDSATGTGPATASATATLNPMGSDSQGWFEYGRTTEYGLVSEAPEEVASGGGVTFTHSFSALSCGTTYHVRAVASNAGGRSYGGDLTFTTSPCASLDVALGGTGHGTVTSEPQGINCGPDCAAGFMPGTPVTLTAMPAADSELLSWGGACSGTEPTCELAMETSQSATVVFALLPTYELTVTKVGSGEGAVTSTPPGINCGTDCVESYTIHTDVTLTAGPGPEARFEGWGGACSGTATSCQVTMDEAKSVSATFAPTRGSIAGTVRNVATLEGLPGLPVEVFDRVGTYVSGATTDGAGNYLVGSLIPGEYFVRTHNSDGYVDMLYPTWDCPNGSCDPRQGTPIAVAEGETAGPTDFDLRMGGAISGTVWGLDDQPLQGVEMRAATANNFHIAWATTDALGHYELRGLPAGDHFVLTNGAGDYVDELYQDQICPSGSCQPFWGIGTPVAVTAGATAPNIDFHLTLGGSISGRVESSGGSFIENVDVRAADSDGRYIGFARTDATGAYTLRGLPAGDHFVLTAGAGEYVDELYPDVPCPGSSCQPFDGLGTPVTVAVGAPVTDIILVLDLGGAISGTVTNQGGQPIPGVEMRAATADGRHIGWARTDMMGDYTLSGLPGGNHYVLTQGPGDYVDEVYQDVACPQGRCGQLTGLGTTVAVVPGETTAPIDLTLDLGSSVSGTVTDADSGKPVSGASIGLRTGNGPGMGGATTDTQGRYVVRGVPSGAYYVEASAGDYMPELYEDLHCSGCSVTLGDAVSVEVGSPVDGIDFALELGGSISGTVRDGEGEPIANAEMRAATANDRHVAWARTDESGHYTLQGLEPGDYYVRSDGVAGYLDKLYPDTTCPGGSCQPFTGVGTPVSVTVGVTHANVDLTLDPGGVIEGSVTAEDGGAPLGNVDVRFFDPAGRQAGWARTSGLGTYTSPGLPDGAYFVATENYAGYVDELWEGHVCLRCGNYGGSVVGTPVSVSVGGPPQVVDFALAQGGRISGTVTDEADGQPIAGVEVNLVDADGHSLANGWSDASGAFVTQQGVPSGSYWSMTSNQLGYVDELHAGVVCPGGSCKPYSAVGTRVIVTAGSTSLGVDYALGKGGAISGTVRDTDGHPIANVEMRAATVDNYHIAWATTNESGEYLLTGLPAGAHYVLTAGAGDYVNEVYPNTPCPQGWCGPLGGIATAITVTPGLVAGEIDLVLELGGHISGRVTDSNGDPIVNVNMRAADPNNHQLVGDSTDASGYYTLSSLPPGDYYVLSSGAGHFVDKLYPGVTCPQGSCQPFPGLGTTVRVSAGSTVDGINLVLDLGGSISGTVRDGDGESIANVEMRAATANDHHVAWASTDESGHYTLQGLEPGNYYVRSDGVAGYVDKLYPDTTCPGGSCQPFTGVGTPVSVMAGATHENVDLTLDGGGVIEGAVTAEDGGAPLGNVDVRFFDSAGRQAGWARTSGLGAYTSSGLPDGSYFVATENYAGYIDEVWQEHVCLRCGGNDVLVGTPVTVSVAGPPPVVDFALAQGGRISGRVTDVNGGAVLAGVEVHLRDDTGRSVANGWTDVNGDYVTQQGVPSGDYWSTTDNSLGYVDQLYEGVVCPSNSCQPYSGAGGTPVSVTVGDITPDVNYVLSMGATISGRITAEEDGHNLAGVEVRAADASNYQYGWATTATDGTYTLRGLPIGPYYVLTQGAGGYVDELWNGAGVDGVICPNGSCQPFTGKGTEVSVTPETPVENVDFVLALGGSIAGRVTDAESTLGIVNANVQVRTGNGPSVGSVSSDSLGDYLAQGLPPGDYFLQASAVGHVPVLYDGIQCNGCDVTQGALVHVDVGSTTGGKDFVLAHAGSISGTIFKEEGGGLPGAEVRAADADNHHYAWAQTDSQGHYTLDGLAPGSYYVLTQGAGNYVDELWNGAGVDGVICPNGSCQPFTGKGTEVSVTPETPVEDVDFVLELGGIISGTVTAEAEGGLPSINVNVYDSSGNQLGGAGTDASGNYRSAGLPSGAYYLRTWNNAGYVDKLYDDLPASGRDNRAGDTVTVTVGSTVSGINFVLARGGVISGHVRAESGDPLSGASVWVYDEHQRSVQWTTSGSDGAFSTQGLLPGRYQVNVNSNNNAYVREVYDEPDGLPWYVWPFGLPRPNVTVAADSTTPVEFTLPVAGHITGQVTDSEGNPLPNVSVGAWMGWVGASGTTDGSGQYDIGGLATGSYRVVTSSSDGYVSEFWGGFGEEGKPDIASLPPLGTQRVAVTAGQTTTGVDFALEQSGRIEGTVTGPEGPVPNVAIEICSAAGVRLRSADARTDASGHYVTHGGLPAGSYYARTDNQAGYVNQCYGGTPCAPTLQEHEDLEYLDPACVAGTPIEVTGTNTTGADFALETGVRIEGQITDTDGRAAGTSVVVYDQNGRQAAMVSTDGTGHYVTPQGLSPGNYYVMTGQHGSGTPYVPTLYDGGAGTPCVGCDVTTGQAITVTGAEPGQKIDGVNITVAWGGQVAGQIRDATTHAGVAGGIEVWTAETPSKRIDPAYGGWDLSGGYLTGALPEGDYYLRTRNTQGYIDQASGGVACGHFCDFVGKGATPVHLTAGSTLLDVAFELNRGGSISGSVTGAGGQPIVGLRVQFYDEDGMRVGVGNTNPEGMYISESSFPDGTYYARTVNYAGYPDRLWDGLSCEGECDVTAGTPIVISGGADATGIDFNLSWEIAIEDATVTEGDSGTRFLTFTVTVPQASSPAAPSSSSDSGRSVAKPDGE